MDGCSGGSDRMIGGLRQYSDLYIIQNSGSACVQLDLIRGAGYLRLDQLLASIGSSP